ncbi:MAG TPA: transcription antitermination factor NusB [Candidatus Nanopelagicales bacterium]|nr:transcription antitermination factor NusB [Candidatus Nanopelagicales bacterium]
MTARGKARKKALDVLYEADVRGVSAAEVLDARHDNDQAPTNPYTSDLVWGVVEHEGRIDDLLSTYAQGWTLDRMPAVDRNVLRIGVYELLWCDDVPDAVAISEAVALVQSLSTDESASFVNGLLARILEVKPRLALDGG